MQARVMQKDGNPFGMLGVRRSTVRRRILASTVRW